ncbi:hypothetical protein NJT12_22005 [Flavobacterium sp. AC]|uniref:Lipoprotein n=1 Tax=Flavobacterium azizsancarii TaxID=2961580 RepID=A0ABT4WID9_9FLAO|nr:hypothetical protein [Flavobacterium azizsancarii]MDA6072306.1 hypothetical protein [Flavobacterium azizsancarii]
MKKLLLLGACALLTTMISCTSDDFEDTKANIKPEVPAYAGPGDSPITVPPPPPVK